MAQDEESSLIRTARLLFRDWTLADRDALHSICADARVMTFVGAGQPWSPDETGRFIARAIAMREAHGFCQWALVHQADSQLVGFCGFVPADDDVEIGWRLAPEYWGQGLASEAARMALSYGFETLGCSRIIATVQAKNRASIRVAEKLGMVPERRLHRGGREVIVFSTRRLAEH